MAMRSVLWCVALVSFLAISFPSATPGQGRPEESWRPLFNGVDLAGWRSREPGKPNGWRVVDGVYVNTPPSTDLLTEAEYYDFDLYVEVKPSESTNSGLYLRDIYEVQILNSYGKPLSDNVCGSLYRRLAPAVNACKPAGEWQTFEVSLVGRRLTVLHNGQKLHDGVDVGPLGTGNAGKRPDAPGPLRLQGDHQEVSFRNIRIRPRTGNPGK